jgi:hypothetical protein
MNTNNTSITFVTSFADIYKENIVEDKTIEWRINKFRNIAETGIHIHLFLDIDMCKYGEHIKQFNEFTPLKNSNGTPFNSSTKLPVTISNDAPLERSILNLYGYKNIHIETFDLNDCWVSKCCQELDFTLPTNLNKMKDTKEFMILMNSKAEFLKKAIETNYWNSTHFAWLDFNISYIFKEMPQTLEYLKILTKRPLNPEFLVIPGSWDRKGMIETDSNIMNTIYWRFFGGFLLGDAKSVSKLYDLYRDYFVNFIKYNKKLVWEVNFWAWLEVNTIWCPTWYSADHNDSIIKIPANFCSMLLNDDLKKTNYPYPKVDTFAPGSASYVYHNGKHILNTRYLNYSIMNNGNYDIEHPKNIIISKNYVSYLKDDFMPYFFSQMQDITVMLPSNNCYFYGLEDIRLYSIGETIKFIATNINYSPTGYNRMIIGEYDPIMCEYKDCLVVFPPYDTVCEKNWIPLVKNDEEFFIYKWFPMEIGKMNENNDTLEIVKRYKINSPWFHKVRGSSTFVDNGEFLVGVVHFSEETTPRRYYHMLVALDKETFKPMKFSDNFIFQYLGIEFCIGFTIKNEEYIFWISKKDRDAVMVNIPMDKIILKYDFA